jgi:hypothetical protein
MDAPPHVSRYNCRVPLELVYVHFPKAAGTSLIHGLRSHYGDALLADYTHLPPLDWSHDPALVPDGIRAVCGHFHADRYVKYGHSFRFTFLREPIDNLISIFYFWRTFPPSGFPAHERFLAESPSIFEFAAYPEMQRLACDAYFGGVDLESIDFVGFFERRSEDIPRLSARLGIPLEATLHINRTAEAFDHERRALKADRHAMARLRQQLTDDVAFYERAWERFS